MRAVNRYWLVLILGILLTGCITGNKQKENQPIVFDIWYGDQQEFGKLGMPQKWINILGNLQSEHPIAELSYQLNASEPRPLSLGSDLHRLASSGDFNVDLDVNTLKDGNNVLMLHATDSIGNSVMREVQFSVEKNKKWPLPYSIEWSKVRDLQDVVQVVDGHWVITEDGLRNKDIYYDRVVAFGDTSWSNYEVTTTVTFHSFKAPEPGPPTYNVSHAAIAVRWPGHDVDSLQPHRKWYPMGATAEFRLTAGLDSCRWRIFDGPKSVVFYEEQSEENYRTIETGIIYGMKHKVESIGDSTTRYAVKLWQIHEKEPIDWDFVAIEQSENVFRGSALLLAHNTEVTFGDVVVLPVEK